MPALWLPMIAILATFAAFGNERERNPLVLVLFLAMGGFGAISWRLRIWPLVDSVDDTGDALVVRRGRVMERIAFADIQGVEFRNGRTPRIILQLTQASRLGSRIDFVPHNAIWTPFADHHPMVDMIRKRIQQARATQTDA